MKNIKIVISAIVVCLLFSCEANRDSEGRIVEEGSMDIFQLRVGDCTNDPVGIVDADSEITEFEEVMAVPCEEPHDNEFYARFDLSHTNYPGPDVLDDEAWNFCLDRFEGFVGISYENSILDVTYFYPTAESWEYQDDREIICAVYHIDLEKLTGSMQGSQI